MANKNNFENESVIETDEESDYELPIPQPIATPAPTQRKRKTAKQTAVTTPVVQTSNGGNRKRKVKASSDPAFDFEFEVGPEEEAEPPISKLRIGNEQGTEKFFFY